MGDDPRARIEAILATGRRATSRFGPLANPTWREVILVVVIGGAFVAGVGVINVLVGSTRNRWLATFGLDVMSFGVALALMYILGRYAVRRGVARENEWVSRLPFALVNHFQLLGSRAGIVDITFKAKPPDDWQELVRGINAGALALQHRGESNDSFKLYVTYVGDPSMHELWRAWRRVVHDLLLPVHERYPINRVEILRD